LEIYDKWRPGSNTCACSHAHSHRYRGTSLIRNGSVPLARIVGSVARSKQVGGRNHPGGNPGANLKSISHRCHPILVAFVWELTEDTINLPLSCLQGGGGSPGRRQSWRRRRCRPPAGSPCRSPPGCAGARTVRVKGGIQYVGSPSTRLSHQRALVRARQGVQERELHPPTRPCQSTHRGTQPQPYPPSPTDSNGWREPGQVPL